MWTALLTATATAWAGPTEGPTRGVGPASADAPVLRALCDSELVLIGDVPGSWNAPQAAATLARTLQRTCHRPVRLALPVPADAIDHGAPSGPFWDADRPDGRSSQAMAWAVRRGRATSLGVEPGTVDGGGTLAAALTDRRVPGGILVALVDVNDTRDRDGAGARLEQQLGDAAVLRLNVGHAGGQVWTCEEDGCGPHDVHGAADPDRAWITLWYDPMWRWEGLIWTGPLRPSAPFRLR